MPSPASPDDDEWKPVFVLPNLKLDQPIEGELAALVPSGDQRVVALGTAHPRFKRFLAKFTDAFGVVIEPSILLVRSDAPRAFFVVDAIASFRDAIALSVIPHGRAHALLYPHQHRIEYANTFSFYPWMIDKQYDEVLMRTFGFTGIHELRRFKGQSSPELFISTLRRSDDIDEPLLEKLLERWRIRYSAKQSTWRDQALFRSLNMANQACQMPATVDVTHYDMGRSLALWVSAFEILAHPGMGRSGLRAVYNLLESVDWDCKASRPRRFLSYEDGRYATRRPMASWLYGEIYQLRNAFLHGNPVDPKDLMLKVRTSAGTSKRWLFHYPAQLFRLALTSFLPLTHSRELPPVSDVVAFTHASNAIWKFYRFQRTFEEALHTSRKPAAGSRS